jgi:hypothetical protein
MWRSGCVVLGVLGGCAGGPDCGSGDLEVDITFTGDSCDQLDPDPASIGVEVHLRDTTFTNADAKFASSDNTRFVFAIPSWANSGELGTITVYDASNDSDYVAFGTAGFQFDADACVKGDIEAPCTMRYNPDAGP